MARMTLFALLALLLTGFSAPALAAEQDEQIESDLSSRNIAIESNFTGSRIVEYNPSDRVGGTDAFALDLKHELE